MINNKWSKILHFCVILTLFTDFLFQGLGKIEY